MSAEPITTTDHEAGTLRRASHHRMLAGVARGTARYLDVDVNLVRIAFVVLALLGGVGIPLYLAAWLLIPDDDSEVSLAEELLDHAGLR